MCIRDRGRAVYHFRRDADESAAVANDGRVNLSASRRLSLIHISDIMLTYGNKTLIIDAKYYGHTTQKQYDVNTLHSNNLYQIFTYVKNKAVSGGEVSGMLLYAKTDEAIQPNNTYMMSGNKISVRTLDLDCEFPEIANQLNGIADEFLQISSVGA